MNQWINRSHPQALFSAVFLCYFNAVQGILQALGFGSFGIVSNGIVAFLFITFGLGFGGVGIANDRKWGYWLAIAAAVAHITMYFLVLGWFEFLGTTLILSFIFDVSLILLLTHAQAREYQRVWFK